MSGKARTFCVLNFTTASSAFFKREIVCSFSHAYNRMRLHYGTHVTRRQRPLKKIPREKEPNPNHIEQGGAGLGAHLLLLASLFFHDRNFDNFCYEIGDEVGRNKRWRGGKKGAK